MPIKLPSPGEIAAGSPFGQKKPESSLSDFKALQPKRKSSLADFQALQQQPQQPQNQGSVLGDIGHGLAAGTANLAGAVGDIPNLLTAGAVPAVSPSLSKFAEAQRAQYRPETQQAMQNIQQAEGFGGTLSAIAQNPTGAAQYVVESAPSFVPGLGAVTGASRLARGAALAKGATQQAAQQAAISAGTKAAVGTNATLSGAFAGQQAAQGVREMPQEQLEALPDYQAMIAQGMAPEAAREVLANRAGRYAGAVGAPLGAATGMVGAPIEARLAAGQAATLGGIASRIGATAGSQTLEEGLQEGAEQFAANVGQRRINPEQSLTEGVPESVALGGTLGAVAGGGLSGVGEIARLRQPQDTPPPPTEDTAPPSPTLGLPSPGRHRMDRAGSVVMPDGSVSNNPADVEAFVADFVQNVAPDAQEATAVDLRNAIYSGFFKKNSIDKFIERGQKTRRATYLNQPERPPIQGKGAVFEQGQRERTTQPQQVRQPVDIEGEFYEDPKVGGRGFEQQTQPPRRPTEQRKLTAEKRNALVEQVLEGEVLPSTNAENIHGIFDVLDSFEGRIIDKAPERLTQQAKALTNRATKLLAQESLSDNQRKRAEQDIARALLIHENLQARGQDAPLALPAPEEAAAKGVDLAAIERAVFARRNPDGQRGFESPDRTAESAEPSSVQPDGQSTVAVGDADNDSATIPNQSAPQRASGDTRESDGGDVGAGQTGQLAQFDADVKELQETGNQTRFRKKYGADVNRIVSRKMQDGEAINFSDVMSEAESAKKEREKRRDDYFSPENQAKLDAEEKAKTEAAFAEEERINAELYERAKSHFDALKDGDTFGLPGGEGTFTVSKKGDSLIITRSDGKVMGGIRNGKMDAGLRDFALGFAEGDYRVTSASTESAPTKEWSKRTDAESYGRRRFGDLNEPYHIRQNENGTFSAVPGEQQEQAAPDFESMVAEAARWRGAAIKAARGLTDKKAQLAHSRATTKGDLDAYLMRKFGIDEAEARSVSNALTANNIPADESANIDDFSQEPWYLALNKKEQANGVQEGQEEAPVDKRTNPEFRQTVESLPKKQRDAAIKATRKFKPTSQQAHEAFRDRLMKGGITDEALANELADEYIHRGRDSLTKWSGREDRMKDVENLIRHTNETGEPAYYIEADLRNLGGLNAFAGHTGADKHFKAIADIFHNAIKGLGSTATPYRHGGDEISATIAGDVTLDEVNEALATARKQVDDYVKENGLDAVPHTKLGRKAGVGLYAAAGEILADDSIESALSRADTAVEAQKKGEGDVESEEAPAAGRATGDNERPAETRGVAGEKTEGGQAEGGRVQGQKRGKKGTDKYVVDPKKDSLRIAIAKLGGLDAAEAEAQGIDPAEIKDRKRNMALFGKPVFRRTGDKKTTGRTFDAMAEALSELGYFGPDEIVGANTLLDKLTQELGGKPVYTPDGTVAAEQARAAEDEAAKSADLDELDDSDFFNAVAENLTENDLTDFDQANESTQAVIEAETRLRDAADEDTADDIIERLSQRYENDDDYINAINEEARRQKESQRDKPGVGEKTESAPQERETLVLERETEADIKAREAEQQEAAKRKAEADKKAADKAKADKMRDDFSLGDTGNPQVDFLSEQRQEDFRKEVEARKQAKAAKPDEQAESAKESTPYTEKRHKETIRAIRNGTTSLDDYKQAFADFLASEDEIRAELKKKTVEQLTGKKSVSGYTKAQIINSIIERRMRSYVLSDGFMWSPLTEKYRDAVKRLVESATEADLKEHAARKKAEKEETLKALNNPETLKEFNTFITYKGEGALSDEQRATYDKLLAQQSKAAEAARTERKAAAKVENTQRAVGDGLASELKETKHTKHGYDLFVIQLADRVDKDTYRSILAQAKQLGGWYSKFRGNGAIPGFQFKDRESAEQFQKLIAGDEQAADAVVEKAAERVEKKLDAKQQKAANRLRQQAERLNDKAEEALNAERKTNTPKRAREAAYAEANARADQAFAKTMLNLADAIETGATEFLQNISTKAHVEELNRQAIGAMQNWVAATQPSYEEGRQPGLEHIQYAALPSSTITLHISAARDIANSLEKIKGGKALANRVRKQGALLVNDAAKAVKLIRNSGDKHTGWQLEDVVSTLRRLELMGITNDAELRTVLREYLQYKEARAAEDPIKKLERELVGTNPGVDFFPTPPALAKRLVEEADIQPGMTVLEPSAGKGDIADAVKEAVPDADIEAVEVSSTLRNILQAKGYNVTSTDFMTHDGEYDRIVMNPPFSDGMDAEHVQHAYDMLKPGGKLVAITGEGIFFRSDKKSKAFRDWLDSVDGTSEKLPEGSFKSSFRPTGVATRLVVVEKPATQQTAPAAQEREPVLYGTDEYYQGLADNILATKNTEGAHELFGSSVNKQQALRVFKKYFGLNKAQVDDVIKTVDDRYRGPTVRTEYEPVELLQVAARKKYLSFKDKGLLGEKDPAVAASLKALFVRDDVAQLNEGALVNDKDKAGNRIPEWQPVKNGFFARQYVWGDTATQEVKAPNGAIARRILVKGQTPHAELEAVSTLDDFLQGVPFKIFDEFFNTQKRIKYSRAPTEGTTAAAGYWLGKGKDGSILARLDEAESKVKQRLKDIRGGKSGKLYSIERALGEAIVELGLELELVLIKGARLIAHGVSGKSAWANAMSAEYGKHIRPHLDDLLKQSRLYLRNVRRSHKSLASQSRVLSPIIPQQGKTTTVADVAKYFDQMYFAKHGKKGDPTNPSDMREAVRMAVDEVRFQLKQAKTGVNWYNDDIADAFDASAQIVPRLGWDENLRVIMTALAAATSYNNRAGQNWASATKIVEHYENTGTFPDRNPANGKLWGGATGPIMAQQIRLINYIVSTLGESDAAKWFSSLHPVSAISAMKAASGEYKTSNIPGGKNELKHGFKILGEKGGAFALNLNGVAETTADKWFSRTFNRHFGTVTAGPLSEQGTVDSPRNETERGLMKQWNREVAKKTGLKEEDSQAVLWYFEQQLYYTLGVKAARSESFSDGAKKLLKDRGIENYRLLSERGQDGGADVATETRIEQNGAGRKKYSRTSNEGITAAAVRDALNLSPQAKKQLLDNQRVRIVQSVSDIPGTHPDDVAGAYHDGAIWLVADNLTPRDAYAVLLHEVVHAELAKLPEFKKILADVEAGIKRGGKPFVEARNTVPRGTPAEHVTEETLAYLVQNNPRLPVVRRLIAAIRAALRKLGLVENYTADDMVRLAHVALKRMAGGNPTTRIGDALYNRADRTSFQGRDTDTLPQAAQQAMAALNRVWTGDRLESVAKAKRELRGNRDAIDWLETNQADVAPNTLYSRRANTPDDAESLLREFDSAYKAAPRLQDSAYKSWDSVKNMARNKRRAWLGLLTRQQIVDVGKDVQPQAELFERLARQKDADENQLVQEHADILKTWSKRISRFTGRKDNAQMALLARTMHEATIAGFDPDKDSASTPDEKRLARAWAALDASSKQLYRDVRDAYSKRRDELEMALAIRIAGLDPLDKTLPKTKAGLYERAFNKLQQDAQDGTAPNRRQTLAMLRASMESNRVKGPYFPLSRFGDYYITAEKAGEEKQFLMTESPAEWRRMQKELKSEGWTVTAGKKIENLATEMGPGINFMQDVFNIVEGSDASIDEATMKAMKDDLWQMYLRTLPDQSIRKHYIHRQNRRGFSQDAFRAFAHHTGHSSKQIARLRYSGALGDTLDAMKANIEGNSDPEKASDIADALNKSYQWMMAPNTARWAQRATSLGFAWYLGISPAAAAINLTQTPIVTFPVLSARYGTAKAGRELTRALKDYSANIRPGKWDAFLSRSGDLGRALKELEDSGAIDRTLTLSMLGMDSENVDLVKTQSGMMRTIGWFFHQAERANREITAIAAYRLARDAGRNHDQAVQAAYNAIYESHFDYSSGNRAQFMRGNTARVLLLFRQFSQNMLYTLWRNAQQSLKGASPEARKEARKKLGGILGMTAVFSGVMGLPLMSSALWVAQAAHDMFSDDDDEEWDAELALRQQLSEWFGEAGGSAVARGAFGAGIGSRTGLNDLILRSPDRDLEGKALAAYYLEQAAGPLAGIGINAFRGAELMSQGQLYRGIEAMTPKAVKDALRSARYWSEGVQSLRGDPIVARDDLSYWELFMQLNGLAPHEIIERYEQNNNLKRLEQKILNRRRSILNAYYMAWRDKDREGMREARQKMAGFNKAYPQARITPQSVSRSFKARERASRENQDGMFYNKSLRPLLQEQRYAA